MKELLRLRIPLRSDIMTTVRLTTGGVCSLAGLTYDGGEDCKVCVTESLLLLLHGGCAAAEVVFTLSERLEVRVEGLDPLGGQASSDEDEIAAALLNALAGDVAMQRREGVLREIAFTFGLQE